MALAAAPFAAQAETWNIYGWQNHSWEFVDIDGGRSFDRIQSNAGNIGFAASVPTGMNDISVNVRCEQFTYFNHFAGGTGWCNRNSKIGLSHPQMGEIMLATWLLPYNEGVAQWVDPFYDAGADSHTSIMGSVGAHTIFYNTGDFDFQASASGPGTGFSGAEFNYAGGGYDTGFNRRQENIIQYWSPDWNGFVFRFAWTAGIRDESAAPAGSGDIDPVIRSSSLAYTNGPLWLAVTWQDHEDWTAVSVGEMESSDAESFRVAGRYIMDLGDGMSVQISAMWEDLEYEFNGVTSVEKAMAAFGYSDFMSSGNLTAVAPAASYKDKETYAADPFVAVAFQLAAFTPATFAKMMYGDVGGTGMNPRPLDFTPADNADGTPNADKTAVLKEKTLGLLWQLSTNNAGNAAAVWLQRNNGPDNTANTDDDIVTYTMVEDDGDDDTSATAVVLPSRVAPTGSDTIQKADDIAGNDGATIFDMQEDDPDTTDVDESKLLTATAQGLKNYLDGWGAAVTGLKAQTSTSDAEKAYIKVYDDLVVAATAKPMAERQAAQAAYDAAKAVFDRAQDSDEGVHNSAYNAAKASYDAAKTVLDAASATLDAERTKIHTYIQALKERDHDAAYEKAKADHDAAEAARVAAGQGAGSNVKVERDAWMVSGKIKFGGPVDFRFSYMDADDLEVSCAGCSGDWDETAADAWNVGLFYTMPAGTELRLTYSEVDNDDNGTYGQGISGTGLGSPGAEIEMFAVGIVHWFD